MIIGVPKETKQQEHRVGTVPAMVHSLVEDGHTVLVEAGGGIEAGITDDDFVAAGATVRTDAEHALLDEAVLRLRPESDEPAALRPGQLGVG